MTNPPQKPIDEMLTTNKEQSSYYAHTRSRGSLATRLWRSARHRLEQLNAAAGISTSVDQGQLDWLGDLSNKSVLDLGCGTGNPLSLTLAARCNRYLAIDLSTDNIQSMRKRLASAGHPHAAAEVIDFLSPTFVDMFDVIYARAVLHHFRYFDDFLQVLYAHLNPGGAVVSYDPLQTHLGVRFIRTLYRPFQSDRDWEFPFSRATFPIIQKYFAIEKVQGVFGYAKWALPLALVSQDAAQQLAKGLHQRDLRDATALNANVYGCMHVSMLLRRLPDV